MPNQQIDILTRVEDIEAIREEWTTLQWHFNADIDFYLTIIAVRDNVISPYVMVLREEGVLKVILVGRIDYIRLDCKLGYINIFRPKIRHLTILYGGILGKCTKTDAKILLESLLNSLHKGTMDSIQFDHLKHDSFFLEWSKLLPKLLCRDYFPIENFHWILSLKSTFEDFISGLPKKTRQNLRSHARRFEKEFNNRISIRTLCDVKDVQRFLDDCEAIASKSYQRGLNVGFTKNEEWRRVAILGFSKKWLIVMILYIDEVPCAYNIRIKYKGNVFTSGCGYDSKFRQYGIGNYIQLKNIEFWFKESGIERIDFGFGDAIYKKELCDQKKVESSIYIFAPVFRGILINIIRTILIVASEYFKKIAMHFGIFEKIKRKWRDRLISRC